MSIKNALGLLEMISEEKDDFLDIANAYVADKLNIFDSVENYVFVSNGGVTPFSELSEFDNLRDNVKKIESADKVIDEFFEISDDIDKIIKYLDEEVLISYVEVEGANEVNVSESVIEDTREAETSSPNLDTAFVVGSTYEPEPAVKVVYTEPADEEQTGVTGKSEEITSASDISYDEAETFDDEPISDHINLFEDDILKTDSGELIAEAEHLLKEASNYIFIGCNPNLYLSKRFEYYRIKYAMKNILDGAETDGEVQIIKNEIAKIKGYIKYKAVISVQMIEHDMGLVEKVYAMLKEFDESLYKPELLPNISELLGYIDSLCDYDVKSTLLHKFFAVETPKFLKEVYANCSTVELDKNKRLEKEKDRIEKESFDAIMELEREYYVVKNSLKNRLLGGKNEYATKRKELDKKYKDELDAVEKEITEMVERDSKIVNQNMKLYNKIDSILNNNIVCFKAK